jgi:hypothetical protein
MNSLGRSPRRLRLLAELVCEHRLALDEAATIARELAHDRAQV